MTDPLDSIGLPKLDDPTPDPPPKAPGERKKRSDAGKPRGPRGSRKSAITDSQLEEALEELLVVPSIPAALFYPTMEGKLYLMQHYVVTAPWGAKKLVQASKMSPALRRALERVREEGAAATILTFLAVWLGGPIVMVGTGNMEMAEGITALATMDQSALQGIMEKAAENMAMNMMTGAQAQVQVDGTTQPTESATPEGESGESSAQ